LLSGYRIPQQPTQENFLLETLPPFDTIPNQQLQYMDSYAQIQLAQGQHPQHSLDSRLRELLQVEQQVKALLLAAIQPPQSLPQLNHQLPAALPQASEPLQQIMALLRQNQYSQQSDPLLSLLSPSTDPTITQQSLQQLLHKPSIQSQQGQIQQALPQQVVQQLIQQLSRQAHLQQAQSQQSQQIPQMRQNPSSERNPTQHHIFSFLSNLSKMN